MRKDEISDADVRDIREQLDAEEASLEIPEGKDPSGRNTVSQRIEHETVTGSHGHGGVDDLSLNRPSKSTEAAIEPEAEPEDASAGIGLGGETMHRNMEVQG